MPPKAIPSSDKLKAMYDLLCNNVVFDKPKGTIFLQVISMVADWIQLCSLLLTVDQMEHMDTGTVTPDFYFQTT
jgi:hypothetical protein